MKQKLLANIRHTSAALVLTVLIVSLVPTPIAFGQLPGVPSTIRKERPVLPKPEQTLIDSNTVQAGVIVVKFREGTHLRLQDNQWIAPLGARSPDEARLLARVNLSEGQVLGELGAVNSLLQSNPNVAVARLFTRPEEELDLEKQVGELNNNEELADLNLYYHLFIDNARVEEVEALLDQLNALDIVEIAYPQPVYHLPQATPGATPDFTGRQGYLNAAFNAVTSPSTNGLDARYAWTLAGGKGQGMRMIDIEFDWRSDHEDLPGVFYSSGVRTGVMGDRSHGTAVLGVVAGVENTFGITGMASGTQIGFSGAYRQVCTPLPCRNVYDVADALNRAAGQLAAGNIILIEQQIGGPRSGLTCGACGNCSQFEDVPVEYNQAEYDAIRSAVFSNSLIVVEAAGNGTMDLDNARYGRRFDPSFRDSFAIMVGAGTSGGRAPQCWSNAGSRVNVQGWGDSVTSTGYGDLFGGTDERRWYTSGFSGTSSASPMVVSAAAAVQGVRRARGITLLTSFQIRGLLRDTGTAQASGRPIGPLPNLKEAIALYVDGTTGVFFRYGIPDQPFRTIAEAVNVAWNNAQIKIRQGTYRERGTYARPMIWMSTGGTVTIGP